MVRASGVPGSVSNVKLSSTTTTTTPTTPTTTTTTVAADATDSQIERESDSASITVPLIPQPQPQGIYLPFHPILFYDLTSPIPLTDTLTDFSYSIFFALYCTLPILRILPLQLVLFHHQYLIRLFALFSTIPCANYSSLSYHFFYSFHCQFFLKFFFVPDSIFQFYCFFLLFFNRLDSYFFFYSYY